MDAAGEISLENLDHGQAAFALIFEFATEGTILDYVQSRLRPSHVKWNWKQVASALETIAAGLALLHKRGILHR